jgi:UDP:flavonoid glycosyltransferase YjiC (YdhE family)
VRDAVRTVLDDRAFTANMRRLQEIQAGYDGPREVARILLEEADALL